MTSPVADSCIVSPAYPAVVFVNPTAGGGRTGSHLPQIQRVFEELKFPVKFVLTNTAAEMRTRAHEAIAEGRKIFIAMGGDGTLQELANATFGADVILGVLPVGGGNDFAAALGLPRNPVKAAHAMLQGETRWLDLVRARTGDGRERLYLGGGGVGLDAEAVRYANTSFRRVPGRLRYIASALRALGSFKSIHICAEFPGSDLPCVDTKVLLAAVLNTPTYGAGVRLAPEALPDDGLLNVILVGDLGFFEVLALLPRLLKSGELHTNKMMQIRARSLRLSTDRPCLFHGDGEILGPSPVEIEVVPHAVRMLAPAAV
jgi:diacylglycerol kinase (ATP)